MARDIYELVDNIKDARSDLKMLQDLRSKKLGELDAMAQIQFPNKWQYERMTELRNATRLLQSVMDIQWNTIRHIQEEIDEVNAILNSK